MPTLTMSTKGQVTIPKDLREQLRLQPGTRIDASVDDQGRLILVPALYEPEELFDDRPAVDRTLTVDDMAEAIARATDERS